MLREQVAALATPWSLATLELGLRFEQLAVDFWAEQMAGGEAERRRHSPLFPLDGARRL